MLLVQLRDSADFAVEIETADSVDFLLEAVELAELLALALPLASRPYSLPSWPLPP